MTKEKPLRLLISTPCAMGYCTFQYTQSLVSALAHLGNDGIAVTLKMQGTESLINRGRNTDATYALLNGFDKILFIDSDMVFEYYQIKSLLESDKLIIGGTYPIKNFPITLNFNPLPEQCDLFGINRQRENFFEWRAKYAEENGEVEVRHVPTGFLMVDTKVLADLTYKVPWYRNYNPDVKTTTNYYEFFPTHVVDNELLSEDWGFCNVAALHGHKVYLHSKVVTKHVGSMVYSLEQKEVTT